jgi:hypothetical protein
MAQVTDCFSELTARSRSRENSPRVGGLLSEIASSSLLMPDQRLDSRLQRCNKLVADSREIARKRTGMSDLPYYLQLAITPD